MVAPAAAQDDVVEVPPLDGRIIPDSGFSIVSGLAERFERQHLAFKKVRILLVGGKGDVHYCLLVPHDWSTDRTPQSGQDDLPALFIIA